MATADSIRKELKIFEETTFSTKNADWVNTGTLTYAFDIDISGLAHPTIENQNYHTRPSSFHPNVKGLKSASAFAFSTHLTATGTNAAEQANGVDSELTKLFRAAWGGRHLGISDGFSGVGTDAAPEVDTIADWEIGDWFFSVDTVGTGKGEFYQVIAKPGGNVITPDRTMHFTPTAADQLYAVIECFIDTDVFDHTDAEYKTLQYLVQGHHTEDLWEIMGCKPTVEISGLAQGEKPMCRWSNQVTDWNSETLTKETLTGTPEGESPLVVGTGDDTYFYYGDRGSHVTTPLLGMAPTVGAGWTPVDGANGHEGRHHYVPTVTQPTVDFTLLYDDDHAADFVAGTEKTALFQVSSDPLEAIGIYFPRLQITSKPTRGDAGGRATTTVSCKALENDTANSLTGSDKEKFLSPICVLIVA